MDDFDFLRIMQLITKTTGIIPRDSHKTGIKNFVEKRIPEISAENNETVLSYFHYLLDNPQEVVKLINSATVNETYFFREEAQFKLLKQKIFPELKIKNNGKIKIWSAASSSGEEIFSLYLLAASMGIDAECTASDINTNVLEICGKGTYKKNAIRTVDGAAFQNLLVPYQKDDGGFQIPQKICEKIKCMQINLSNIQDFPKNQDIIFIRNVFIYFSSETRKMILKRIAEDALADGGYIFVSMNETASIEKSMLPDCLKKCSDGNVFYFQKQGGKE